MDMKQQDTMDAVNMTALLEVVKSSDETDTTKSRSTPPTSDAASASSTLNDELVPEGPQYDDAILGHLARQLEYYFSQANLEKDTYVETLRKLNDSYVPVSILQRFQKVQAFAPIETVDAILKAATEFSSLLEVVSIDTKTGKRVEEDGTGNTLLAVGTISREPLDNSGLQAVVPTTPTSPIQNTIIIREVDPSVTEAEVRTLFDEEHCPPIQSLYLDVFNCWFVTLDTASRDDMLFVMMQLRSQYLGDDPVKARLKSLVRQVDPTHAPGLPVLTPVSSYTQLSNITSNGNKKRPKKKRSKNNATSKGNNNNNQGGSKKNGSKGNTKEAGSTNKKEERQLQPKPDLSFASFPALTDESRKVEVLVDGIDSAPNAVASDTCSTVTTLSSSSSNGKQQLGGYAAALLKAKPAEKDEGSVQSSSNQPANAEEPTVTRKIEVETTVGKQAMAPSQAAQVVVKPPVWGGGRSFADVLAM